MPPLTTRNALKWLAVLQPAASKGKNKEIPTGDAVVICVGVDDLMLLMCKPNPGAMQDRYRWSMQVSSQVDRMVEEQTIDPSTETNVVDATVGDTGHINVLRAEEEDVPQHEVDEEDVVVDVAEEETMDRYRLV